MYMILEDNRGRLSHCPQKWLKTSSDGKEIKYWPKSNQNALIGDPESEPILSGENKWLTVKDKIKRRNIRSKSEAEREMNRMCENTRTETETSDNDGNEEQTILRNAPQAALVSKVAKKTPYNIEKYKVSPASTPPKSVLHTFISGSNTSSPKTPTNKILQDAQQLKVCTPNNGTPPSAMLPSGGFISMHSAFNTSTLPMQHELDILTDGVS